MPDIAPLLPYLAPIVAAVIVALPGLLAWRTARHTAEKVQQVHLVIDGRLDQLVAEVRAKEFAAGLAEGRRQQLEIVAGVIEVKTQTVKEPMVVVTVPPVQESGRGI